MKCKYRESINEDDDDLWLCTLKEKSVFGNDCSECTSFMPETELDAVHGVKLINPDVLPECARFPKDGKPFSAPPSPHRKRAKSFLRGW